MPRSLRQLIIVVTFVVMILPLYMAGGTGAVFIAIPIAGIFGFWMAAAALCIFRGNPGPILGGACVGATATLLAALALDAIHREQLDSWKEGWKLAGPDVATAEEFAAKGAAVGARACGGVKRVKSMRHVKSCGVLLFRRTPDKAFLLMKHRDRLDLPKGHLEPGESEIECALRELEEETGISKELVQLDRDFRFETSYQARYKRFGYELVNKTLVVFLGYLDMEVPVVATEHRGFSWIAWNPPHRLQAETIDPLLAAAESVVGA